MPLLFGLVKLPAGLQLMPPSMPQPGISPFAPQPQAPGKHSFLRKLLGRPSNSASSSPAPAERRNDDPVSKPGIIRRMSRKVVPGLPRAQTFKRQQSEHRQYLAPINPTLKERRAVSVDRRSHGTGGQAAPQAHTNPRASAPSLLGEAHLETASEYAHSLFSNPVDDGPVRDFAAAMAQSMSKDAAEKARDAHLVPDTASMMTDSHSMTTSQYEVMIHEELEKVWILNLSMHFRDRSRREKFFVTYREHDHLWRRVTISLDYRDAPTSSLEMDLINTKCQRDKSAKIYEAIRDSLPDIQFYETVTNLKLETTAGRLHVHVVEDGNEIIHYPLVSQVRHLGCRRIKERDIVFGSHMSGFVYKVSVQGHVLIKKEIPSPDTVEEFLYEVHALNSLRFSNNVIKFYGVVVDDRDEYIRGILISYAGQGALIDTIYENCKEKNIGLPWSAREKWARQIVQGLADIHESGFVQGDFTLSNIVIDSAGDAKIIDINRRGCPVGWEPPEAAALIRSNQRLSMYIGVKSDLYQLGMVLWGLAMLEDEPEAQGRPLILGPEINVPDWYRQVAEICLSDDPRMRLQATSLLQMFPRVTTGHGNGMMQRVPKPIFFDHGQTLHDYLVDGYNVNLHSGASTAELANEWAYSGTTCVDNELSAYDQHYYYGRGRSPPSPMPSNCDKSAWAANRDIAPSYNDSADDDDEVSDNDHENSRQPTPVPAAEVFVVVGPDNPHASGLLHPLAQEDGEAPASAKSTGNSVPDADKEPTLPEAYGSARLAQATPIGSSDMLFTSNQASTDANAACSVPAAMAPKEEIDAGYVKIESADIEQKSKPETRANGEPSPEAYPEQLGAGLDGKSPGPKRLVAGAKAECKIAADSIATKDDKLKTGSLSVKGDDEASKPGKEHHTTDMQPVSSRDNYETVALNSIGLDPANKVSVKEAGNDEAQPEMDERKTYMKNLLFTLTSTNADGSGKVDPDGSYDKMISQPRVTCGKDDDEHRTWNMPPPGEYIHADDGDGSPSSLHQVKATEAVSRRAAPSASADRISMQNIDTFLTQDQDKGLEAEDITSHIPGATAPNDEEDDSSAEQAGRKFSEGDYRQCCTHVRHAGAKGTVMPTPTPMEPPQRYVCPRQASLSLSLTGIGAANVKADGDLRRQESGVVDDGLNMMGRPKTAPNDCDRRQDLMAR